VIIVIDAGTAARSLFHGGRHAAFELIIIIAVE
jgi:hypothetical protein